jgi:cell division protein FtsI/penicillin-binding protein 2
MKHFKSKQERVQIVTKILHQLKTLNLLTDQTPSIKIAVDVLRDYVNLDENKNVSGLTGNINVPEIKKEIHYILPLRKHTQPTFVIKNKV